MKKLISLTLLLLLLTGCGASAPAEPEAPPPVPVDPVPAPVEEPLTYRLETLLYEEAIQTENGTELASVRFELPQLQVLRGGEALETGDTTEETRTLEKAADFNSQFDCWTDGSMVEELKTWVLEDYKLRPEFFGDVGSRYTEELTHSAYQTETLISVAGFYYTYTGGAHPNSWMFGWNYDLTTGEFLTVPSLAEDEEGFRQAIAEEIIRQAGEPLEDGTAPLDGYWEDYADIVADWSSYAVFFDEDGMTVVFSPYELASYAAGSQIFTIPYDILSPWLSDRGTALLGLQTE